MSDKNNSRVKSAISVGEAMLQHFYQQAFNNRHTYLSTCWRWLYNVSFFENQIPLIVENDEQILAHAGMIPFHFTLNNQIFSAGWFVDFKILEEFQRKGLGSMLERKWVEIPDCCFAFCNEKSLGVFKKNGWYEGYESYRIMVLVNFFDHPGFTKLMPKILRTLLNTLIKPILYISFHPFSRDTKSYSIAKLSDEGLDSISLQLKNKGNLYCKSSTVRDDDYLFWRLKQSPNYSYYHIYTAGDFMALLLIHNNHGSYIDILWISDTSDKNSILRLVRRLGLYGIKNKIAYIRMLTFNKSIVTHIRNNQFCRIEMPKFVFFSKEQSVFEEMKNTMYDFELIDSDFEHIDLS